MKNLVKDGINHKALAASINRRHGLFGDLKIQSQEIENEHWLLRAEHPDLTPEKILKLLVGRLIRVVLGESVLRPVDFGGGVEEFWAVPDEAGDPAKIIEGEESATEAIKLLKEFRASFPILNFLAEDEKNGQNLEILSKKLRKRAATVSKNLKKEFSDFENLKRGIKPISNGLF